MSVSEKHKEVTTGLKKFDDPYEETIYNGWSYEMPKPFIQIPKSLFVLLKSVKIWKNDMPMVLVMK